MQALEAFFKVDAPLDYQEHTTCWLLDNSLLQNNRIRVQCFLLLTALYRNHTIGVLFGYMGIRIGAGQLSFAPQLPQNSSVLTVTSMTFMNNMYESWLLRLSA